MSNATFTPTNSYSLSSHSVDCDGSVLRVLDSSRSVVYSHDINSSGICIKKQNGDFCIGTIVWGTYTFIKYATQNGPCAKMEFKEEATGSYFIGTGNEDSGDAVTKKKFDISQAPLKIWINSNNKLCMKAGCEGNETCSTASFYSEEDEGTCV